MNRTEWTREQYFADQRVSASMMRCYETEGPLVAFHKYIKRDMPSDDTKDWQRLGTAFHAAMEDIQAFKESYYLVPTIVPDDFLPEEIKDAELKSRGKVIDGHGSLLNKSWQRHKLYLQDQQAAAEMQGKAWLTEEEADTVWMQVQAVWDNPACAKYLGPKTRGNREVALIAELNGVPCKGLIDILRADEDAVVDFKTTRHRTKEAFIKDATGKGYHYQLAHYAELACVNQAVIVAVTKEFPFEAMAYTFSQSLMEDAREANQVTREKIKNSLDAGSWHTLGFGTLNIIGDEF